MNDFPLVIRQGPVSVLTPAIPLAYGGAGLSVEQVLAILWARRWLITLIVGFVMTGTIIAMTLWPRSYTATATLMVNYEVTDPLNGNHLPIGQVGSYIATQIELMQTPEVLLAVVDRLDLTTNRHFNTGYKQGVATLREWTAANLRKTLAVYQGAMGSQLIHIGYSAPLPGEAAQVANMLAIIYKEQDFARSAGPPGERAARYGQQLDELKKKVDRAQSEISSFRQRHGLIDGADRSTVDVALLSTLESKLLEARTTRLAAEARAAGDQAVSDGVLASPEVMALKSQLTTQELRLAHLNTLYTPQHPDIFELTSQIALTRQQLRTAVGSFSANATAGRNVASRLDTSLEAAVAQQRSRVLLSGQLHDESAKYQLELDSAQTVYRRALEGFDQVLFATTGKYANVALVSQATPPVRPSKPKVLTGLALGAMLAGVLALVLPLMLEFFQRRIRCRDDVERQLRVPVLIEFGRVRRQAA